MEFFTVLFLILVSLFAGFIDSIAGGGGLFLMPALFFSGIPAHSVLGTNKLVASSGTAVALRNYIKNGAVILKVVLYGLVFALVGAVLGTKAILFFNEALATKIILVLLPFGLVALLIPKGAIKESTELSKLNLYVHTPLICTIVGFYDGFFGAGAGTFLTLGFYFILKVSLVSATGIAKVFNLVSNVSALITFIIAGKVLFLLAIPLAIANMIGGYFGSTIAIKNNSVIKYGIAFVCIIVFVVLFRRFF